MSTDDIGSGGAQGAPAEGGAPQGDPGQGGAPDQGGVRQGGGGEGWQPQSPADQGGGVGGGGAAPAQGGGGAPAQGAGGEPGAGAQGAGGQPGGAPQGAGGQGGGAAGGGGDGSTPLLPDNDASEFERRWQDVQVGFVDEPQRCVQDADSLVAEVMQRLADEFARERKNLEAQWAGGGEASTEDLRIALQRYRSFFNRLLRTT